MFVFCLRHKIRCRGNVSKGIRKRGPGRENSCKYLSFGEKIVKIGPEDPEIICLKLKKEETRNAWQSLAYSPLGATVSPPSNTKPCYHLANVQRMHVVSVCVYYGKIIWLPWQHPLTNWKIWYRSIICT